MDLGSADFAFFNLPRRALVLVIAMVVMTMAARRCVLPSVGGMVQVCVLLQVVVMLMVAMLTVFLLLLVMLGSLFVLFCAVALVFRAG